MSVPELPASAAPPASSASPASVGSPPAPAARPSTPEAPPAYDPAYPNLRQAIALLLLLLVLQAAVGLLGVVALAIAGVLLHRKIEAQALLITVANVLTFWFVVRRGVRRTGLPWTSILPLRGIPLILVLPMAAAVLGAHLVSSELENAVERVWPSPAWFGNLFGGPHDLGGQWSAALLAGVVAPLTEEPLFRGLLLHGFARHYPATRAILAAAILFGLLHLNPWQFPAAVLLGAVFGWLVLRTGSLWPALVGHAAANLLPLLTIDLLHFDVRIPGYANTPGQPIQWQPAWFDALGLLLIVLGVLATHHLLLRAARLPDTPPHRLPIVESNGRP